MSKNDGGPAYPMPAFDNKADHPADRLWHHKEGGMSLRDWFAGQALAMLGNSEADKTTTPSAFARDAYRIADAMLAERAK